MKNLEKFKWKLKKYFRLIKIWESNYGRKYGWILKKDGVEIAELIDFIEF